MPAYLIYHQTEVTAPDGWEAYRSKVGKVLANFGARVVAADHRPKALEGEWSGTLNVIIEFPDMASIERFYQSHEYKPLLDLRLSAAGGKLIAVNGL